MVLCGHIQEYPLAELLFFLSTKQRTGQLVLKRSDMRMTFTMRRGRLIAAQMVPADHRLGDHLLADGLVSPDLLSEALQYQRTYASDRPLGTLLVERGYLEAAVVFRALREQIIACLVTFLIAPDGTFRFEEKEIDTSRINVDVIVEREVFEAIRLADEYVARQIDTGPLRLKPHVDTNALKPFVVENWDLIDAMIGGAQTVDEIVTVISWERERVVRTLQRLQASGAIALDFQLVTPSDTAV